MATHIRDEVSEELVARVINDPMPLRCSYAYEVINNADGTKTLVGPKVGQLVSLLADEIEPNNLPLATEINPQEFLIDQG